MGEERNGRSADVIKRGRAFVESPPSLSRAPLLSSMPMWLGRTPDIMLKREGQHTGFAQ